MADIEFTAYADDCLFHAHLNVPDGSRLTDYLNELDKVHLTDVELLALEDGRLVRQESLDLDVDDIFVIEAPAAGKATAHKIRTRTSRVEVELGPYRVLGHLHGPSGGDPFAAITRRKSMVPITEATVAFTLNGQARMRDVDVVIVNRMRASLVQRVVAEPDQLAGFGISAVDPNAKDLTHELSYGIRDPYEDR